MKATLSDLVTIANPLDYHTFVWAKEEAMTETFSAMIGCGFDLSMLVLDFPRSDRCSDADWDFACAPSRRRRGAPAGARRSSPRCRRTCRRRGRRSFWRRASCRSAASTRRSPRRRPRRSSARGGKRICRGRCSALRSGDVSRSELGSLLSPLGRGRPRSGRVRGPPASALPLTLPSPQRGEGRQSPPSTRGRDGVTHSVRGGGEGGAGRVRLESAGRRHCRYAGEGGRRRRRRSAIRWS